MKPTFTLGSDLWRVAVDSPVSALALTLPPGTRFRLRGWVPELPLADPTAANRETGRWVYLGPRTAPAGAGQLRVTWRKIDGRNPTSEQTMNPQTGMHGRKKTQKPQRRAWERTQRDTPPG